MRLKMKGCYNEVHCCHFQVCGGQHDEKFGSFCHTPLYVLNPSFRYNILYCTVHVTNFDCETLWVSTVPAERNNVVYKFTQYK